MTYKMGLPMQSDIADVLGHPPITSQPITLPFAYNGYHKRRI